MRGSPLHTLINGMFDLLPHFSGIPQDFVPRKPDDLVPLLGQISVAALIMPAAFVGLMMLTIDLNDQLQCHATEINRVRRDRVFTTELLPSATSVADHLPDVACKLVRAGSLIARQRNRLWISPRSSVHAAPRD